MTTRYLAVGFFCFIGGMMAGSFFTSLANRMLPVAVAGVESHADSSEGITITPVEPSSAGQVAPIEPVAPISETEPYEDPVEEEEEEEEESASGPMPIDSSASVTQPRVIEINGVDLRTTLRHLARAAAINLVVSDGIVGSVTLRLTDITPLKAFEIICTSKGVLVDHIDGVYYVKTHAERASEPSEFRSFSFVNAKAAEAAEILKKVQPIVDEPVLDLRTNTILYRAHIGDMESILHFLKWLDRSYPADASQPVGDPFTKPEE